MDKGIMKQGFGIIPKLIMRDLNLSIEAKGIYAYMCSFAGSGQTAFPSIDLMVKELNMSKKRFLKYRKELLDKQYISIIHQRNDDKQGNNIYILKQTVNIQWSQNDFQEGQNDFQGGQFGIIQGGQIVQNQGGQNVPTNNNSINNNSINNINNNNYNNNIVSKNNTSSCCCQDEILKLYEELGFGLLNRTIMEFLDDDVNRYSKEWVIAALKESSKRGKYNLKYVEGILKNWKTNGRNDNSEPTGNDANNNTESEKHIHDGYDFSKFYPTGPEKEEYECEDVDF